MTITDSPVTRPLIPDTGSYTHLHGLRLWLARGWWFAAVTLGVWMFVSALPAEYAKLRQAGELAPIEALGISPDIYALFNLLMEIAPFGIFMAVAILIFWRRSDDRIALLASLMLATMAVVFGPTIDSLVAIQPLWHAPQVIVQVLGYGSFVIFFYLFPDARFVPRWTRWLAFVWLVFVAWAASTGPIFENLAFFPVGLTVAWATSVGAQVYRYRHVSTPVQRQQTKWIVIAMAAMLVGVTIGFVPLVAVPAFREGGIELLIYNPIRVLLFANIPLSFLPLGIVISVLRYRLWDVDFVINRSLVYGGLTLVLGGIFVGAFFAMKALWEAILGPGQEVLAAVLPAVFIALIFNPTRKRLRQLVDSQVYGIKLDYIEAVKAYAGSRREVRRHGGARTAFGSYADLSLLGRGGMGAVDLAHATPRSTAPSPSKSCRRRSRATTTRTSVSSAKPRPSPGSSIPTSSRCTMSASRLARPIW